jgi:hypothetical protein
VTGQRIVGGLVYAGQNGANEYQGDPPAMKLSPRVGLVYAMNPKSVMRAGFGTYWSPWNYQAPSNVNYGQIGAARQTVHQPGPVLSDREPEQPVPERPARSRGQPARRADGVGGEIRFIDQNKRAPHVYMYSADFNREIGGGFAVGFEYSGATGRELGLGGANEGLININQVPVQHWALGATALNQNVANPFFGLPAGQGFNVTSPTVPYRQLLRPFPQFGDIMQLQTTEGRNQYHAAILKLEKRVTKGWGGRINYTYSRLNDNQYGESNVYSLNSTEAANNYDLDAEYAIGLLDVPHKLVFSPIVELPWGEGKKWLQSGVGAAILGNWTLSSIISFESGFPFSPNANSNDLSGLGVRMQRVNPGTGDAETDGSRDERIAGNWLNSAAFVDPVGIVQGTLPRNLSDRSHAAPEQLGLRGHQGDSVRRQGARGGSSRTAQHHEHRQGIRTDADRRQCLLRPGTVAVGFMRLTQLAFRVNF